MKKFFKILKERIATRKSQRELSDAYDPDDFDEKTGEYELDKVQFDDSTGQYQMESEEEDESFYEEESDSVFEDEQIFEDENLAAESEQQTDNEGETLADLLKRARETDAEEVLADEEDAFEEAPENIQQMNVSSIKGQEEEEASGNLEPSEELPDFPAELPTGIPGENSDAFFQDEPSGLPGALPEDLPGELPEELLADSDDETNEIHDDFPPPSFDRLDDLSEEEETNSMPGNLADIPAEFNQDLREHLTAETELPSPEKSLTKSGIRGVFGKFGKPETLKSMLKKSEKQVGKLNLLDQFASLYSFNSRPQVHRTFIWIMALGSSAMLGKIIGNALVVTNKDNKTAKQSNLPPRMGNKNKELLVFYENDLFKAAEHEIDKKNPVVDKKPKKKKKVIDLESVCDRSAKKKSGLQLELTHTVVLQDSVKSIAAVSLRGKKTPMTLREGDKIDGKSRIDHINYQELIIKNLESGECEYVAAKSDKKSKRPKVKPYEILPPGQGKKLLENKDADDTIKNEGNKYAIKKEERKKLLSNLDELLTQALAIQIKNPDGSLSFKLTEIVPGSFYTKIGIQNGDIIKSINGKPITNMNQVMTLFGKISEIDQFQLGVLRNGTVMNKEYNFE